MVQKKNRRDLIRGRSSVSRAGVRAYTFVRVFSHEYVFCWFFSNYVEDYLLSTVLRTSLLLRTYKCTYDFMYVANGLCVRR
jgi:hypothetical protein